MPFLERSFHTADGLQLYAKQWSPPGPPRGVLLMVHGLFEHSGRYAEAAERVAEAGLSVVAIDLRGHGQSEGERAWIDRFDRFAEDVARVLDEIRIAGVPLFLFGHSMGGAIAVRLLLLGRSEVDGVILSAPALSMQTTFPAPIRGLVRLLGAVWPRLRMIRVGSGRLSRDPAVAENFRNDPHVFHGRFPIRIVAELFRVGTQMWPELDRVTTPLLVLHGTHDRLACPGGGRRIHEVARSADKTLRLYEGLYHDLLHEPEKEQLLGEIVAWLRARTPGDNAPTNTLPHGGVAP